MTKLTHKIGVNARSRLSQVKRVVLKIGSSVLTQHSSHLKDPVFERIATEISQCWSQGVQFLLVSSGAIAAGKTILGLENQHLTLPQKQAAAAVGQSHLIRRYERSFAKFNRIIGQILLTHNDLSDRLRYINARHTLNTLLENQVIPIINENDTVIVEEIMFGDNDTLGALIAALVQADLLILLTDQDGLFEENPEKNPHAPLIREVTTIDETIEKAAGQISGKLGVGGMSTKVEAAKKAISYGIPTVIANGHKPDIVQKILKGEEIGTLFLPKQDRLTSRKHWIVHTLKSKGKIRVDEGAKKAIEKGGKSLLPAGITAVEGSFQIGDGVELVDPDQKVFAKGIVNYNRNEVEKISGQKTSEIEKILGYKYYDEIIHRDDLVLLKNRS